MAQNHDFGKVAEELASQYLGSKGYRILHRNYRYLKAEVDIIASYQDQIIFVEVKARQSNRVIEPQEAVNKTKMRLLLRAADYFMRDHDAEVRFDIVTIVGQQDEDYTITHIENAFESMDIG